MRTLGVLLVLNLAATPLLAAGQWHTDYATAYHEAKAAKKLLLVSFYGEQQRYTPQPLVESSLQSFVLLSVPTKVTIARDDGEKRLLGYNAFKQLNSGPGLAIVNLKYQGRKYGRVVGTLGLKEASGSATRVIQFLEDPQRKLGPKVLTDAFDLDWHTDYNQAYRQARSEKKLLLVAFDSDDWRFSPDVETADKLREYVLARLRVADSQKLLCHAGLRQFHCGPGIGMINLKGEDKNHGRVVQVLPADYVSPKGTRAMLDLAAGRTELPELKWYTDYIEARAAATEQGKMLLIAVDCDQQVFQPKRKSVPALHAYVLVRQRTETCYPCRQGLRRLLKFRDFEPMRGKPGLIVYDFKHKQKPYYGQVVSVMPYKYLGPNPGNRVFGQEEREHEFLILEPNRLSRRTLTWAIRVSKGHGRNQRLRSADGQPSEHLMAGAARNSRIQCQRGCGHFAGGLTGTEIASPGPGDDIVDGALNMVRIWRSSPPHYGAMVRYHRRFGYDMAASRRNHWYGTGRF